jgi:hypothetical protein
MLRSMSGRKAVNQIYVGAITHYTAEMLQFVRVCRDGLKLPPLLLPYILPKADLALFTVPDALDSAEGLILEVCNTDEIRFDSFYVNRNRLEQQLLYPLQEMGDPVRSIVNDWFYNGMFGHKEEVRAAAVEKLLPLIPSGDPEADMRREVLRTARPHRQDEQSLKSDIAELCALISPNAFVLGHILRYMPDGRPIYWPPAFMRQMMGVCRELDIPYVDPAKVVQEKGPEFSLKDERYYTPEFIDEMGDRLYQTWAELPKR